MKVADLTVEELKALIQEAVAEAIKPLLATASDPEEASKQIGDRENDSEQLEAEFVAQLNESLSQIPSVQQNLSTDGISDDVNLENLALEDKTSEPT